MMLPVGGVFRCIPVFLTCISVFIPSECNRDYDMIGSASASGTTGIYLVIVNCHYITDKSDIRNGTLHDTLHATMSNVPIHYNVLVHDPYSRCIDRQRIGLHPNAVAVAGKICQWAIHSTSTRWPRSENPLRCQLVC